MAESKTQPTDVPPESFIESIENRTRREDAQTLLRLLREATGFEPVMWGPSIIGFGAYEYAYDSGRTGKICAVGFSPRKANLVFYVSDFEGKEALLERLGKHRGGIGQCLYVNKLADVDTEVLVEIVVRGLESLREVSPVTVS